MKLREYQKNGIDVAINTIKDSTLHPVIAIPTGAGKTIIGTNIADKFIANTNKDVLFISHVKEILGQLHESLSEYTKHSIGLYSAGLNSKTTDKITVAGIQSIWKKPELFKSVGLIVIDECHLVNDLNQGMYRSFFNALKEFTSVNYIGLTATPYRARGYIHIGEETLFNCLPYDLTEHNSFSKLVADGYLAKLYTKRTEFELDTTGIKTVAGDFDNKELDEKLNRTEISHKAVKEIVKFGKNFKQWLVFCININHAEMVSLMLNSYGIPTKAVHSEMEEDRSEVLEEYRNNELRCLTNVDVLTTGIDIPTIDFIAMLRPTKSPTIYVQSVGRGLRVARDSNGSIIKDKCLVLDFAGNISRLGPIDYIQIKQKGKPQKGGDPITKDCPVCKCVYHPMVKVCEQCGYIFKFNESLTTNASELSITKKVEIEWMNISSSEMNRHRKRNAPDSIKIEMISGLRKFTKWFAINSQYPGVRRKSRFELNEFVKEDISDLTLEEILKCKLNSIKRIHVNLTEKYPDILSWEIIDESSCDNTNK